MACCKNALSVSQSEEIQGKLGGCQNNAVESQTKIFCTEKGIWCVQHMEMRTELSKFLLT